MDSSDESQSDRGETIVKRVRGSTKLRELVERHEEQRERVHVDFDDDMNPIGDEEDRFISYLGYLARSKVGIQYPNWKLVPPETKERIWQQILQTYDVPDTKPMYKHWMGEIKRKIMKEELEKMKEAAKSDPNIVIQTPAPPPRHQKWKVRRVKGGKYINTVVAEVAERIDELEEQSSQGFFTQSGRMDILSTAIGKPDHPSCVRGEPRGVSLTKYFGRASQHSSQGKLSKELMAKVLEEVRQELKVQLRQSLREELREELLHELRGG
ncbi:hypothetical protein K1719_012254 [Acacia pycnantha]|nr:hypothetical protein K1719_012254 [Acacia pycnantha]